MRKLIQAVLVSADGVIGDPGLWALDYRDADVEHGLIDELRLSIHPVLAGRGQLLFRESGTTPLKLDSVTTLGTGAVVLSYQPVRA